MAPETTVPGQIAHLFGYSCQVIGSANPDRDHFAGELKAACATQYAVMLYSVCGYSQWQTFRFQEIQDWPDVRIKLLAYDREVDQPGFRTGQSARDQIGWGMRK